MSFRDDSTGLTYRPMKGEHELTGVCELYDIAGWGPVTPEQLKSWFVETPLGPSLMMVIADERDRLMGMSISSPYEVQLFEETAIAVRGRSSILRPELRRSGRGITTVDIDDPLRLLGVAARPYVDERGWKLHFSLPNPLFLKRDEMRTYEDEEITRDRAIHGPGLRIDIDERSGHSSPLLVSVGEDFGPEYDVLWDRARSGLGIECAVLRNARGLARARRGQFRLEVRHPSSEELIGYAIFGWQKLHDVLAVDGEALELVLRESIAWLRANPQPRLRFFNSYPHPLYRELLMDEGAFETDWIFSFSVSTREKDPGPELDAQRWYVTTGD